MFARSIELPKIGRLKRGWGYWRGQLNVRELDEPLELRIEISKTDPIEAFAEQATLFVATFGCLQNYCKGELYEQYEFYKKTDLEYGLFTEDEYRRHLKVRSSADVWEVLKPYRLCLGVRLHKTLGNSYLLMKVDWPNPHFFQMFMRATPTGFEYTHTEIVG